MTNAARTLYEFLSGFGIPAYEEVAVPKEATLPYMTYDMKDANWDEFTSITVSLWYQGTSFADLYKKVDEIKDAIGEGLRLPVKEGGCLYLYRDSPFAQVMSASSDTVKMAYLLIGMHCLCN